MYKVSIEQKLNRFLIERKKSTKVEITKGERQLKIDKGRDSGDELYRDFTKFLSLYLNSLENKDLQMLKVINRDKAAALVQSMADIHPEVKAILDKMHLEPAKFVARFWNKMDIKTTWQDVVTMLMKGNTTKKEEKS